MKRAVLLRFHKDVEIVQNRIDVLKHFNPDIPIYGLYGGAIEDLETFKSKLTGIEHIYFLDIPERDIKWRFSDFCVLTWYKDFGKNLNFDILHTIEYDLVILDKLENVYKYNESDDHIYITTLIELDKIKGEWNWFQNPDFPTEECKEFENLLKSKYNIETLYGCQAPGVTITREYLEGYSELSAELPLIAFDEMRWPAIAQILNIPIKNTGFVRDWFDDTSIDFRIFNTDNSEVQLSEMLETYKSGYQKAFHPVYKVINLETIT